MTETVVTEVRRARRLLGALLLGALILPLGTAAPIPRGRTVRAQAERRPNVLIIVTDDQREGLEVMPETSRLLRRNGVHLAPGFVTTPLCCPSRASIFSGRYMHNHGVRTNTQARNLDQRLTMQRYLHDAGYKLGMFGEFLTSWPLYRNPRYFDRWAVSKHFSYYDAPWNVNGVTRTVETYSTRYIARKAERFLGLADRGNDDRPWFLYLATTAPHSPRVPEPDYVDAPVAPWAGNPAVFEDDRSDKPPYVTAHDAGFDRGSRVREEQFRTLMSVDDLVKRTFVQMRALGEKRDTLVFFISDNGFLWGEHGWGAKSVPYTQSISVPFFMRWPRHVIPGTKDPRMAANIDIAPTVLDAAGMTPPKAAPMDGRSLLDVWTRDRILTEYQSSARSDVPTWASLRTTSYQYVEYYGQDGITVEFSEYYDLTRDPWQLENLLNDGDPTNDPDPAALLMLHDQLASDRSCVGAGCP